MGFRYENGELIVGRLGEHCTVGPLAVVLYDSVMEDYSKIEALSLVMKGEILPKNTTWSGSPSKFLG
jgi:carbonic anhydrase/acetyltransferase-like protein (isoleucine patch superfamily)